MSINSALLAGVSGLTANSAALAAISQNIANVNTVGYKRTASEFPTVVNSQTSGTGYSAGGVRPTPATSSARPASCSARPPRPTSASRARASSSPPRRPRTWTPTDTRACSPAPAPSRVDKLGYLKNTAGLYLQGWPVDSDGNINTDPSDLNRLRSINVGSVGGTAEADHPRPAQRQPAIQPGPSSAEPRMPPLAARRTAAPTTPATNSHGQYDASATGDRRQA